MFANDSKLIAWILERTYIKWTILVINMLCGFSDIKVYFENTFDIDESLFASLAGRPT